MLKSISTYRSSLWEPPVAPFEHGNCRALSSQNPSTSHSTQPSIPYIMREVEPPLTFNQFTECFSLGLKCFLLIFQFVGGNV